MAYLVENHLSRIFDFVILRQEGDVFGDDLFGLLLGKVLGLTSCVMGCQSVSVAATVSDWDPESALSDAKGEQGQGGSLLENELHICDVFLELGDGPCAKFACSSC